MWYIQEEWSLMLVSQPESKEVRVIRENSNLQSLCIARIRVESDTHARGTGSSQEASPWGIIH